MAGQGHTGPPVSSPLDPTATPFEPKANYNSVGGRLRTRQSKLARIPPGTDIEQLRINWLLRVLDPLLERKYLHNEVKSKILKPLLTGPNEQPITLTAKNIVDVVKSPRCMRRELLRSSKEYGDLARYVFWHENIVSLHSRPRWHYCWTRKDDEEGRSINSLVLRLPLVAQREHIWRLQFHPYKSPRTQTVDLDNWDYLNKITNGTYQFKNLRRVEVYFEAEKYRMSFCNWMISIEIGKKGECVKIDGDINQPHVEAQLQQALLAQGRREIDEDLLGFVLERKPPSKPVTMIHAPERDDLFDECISEDDLAHIGGVYSDKEEDLPGSDHDTEDKKVAEHDDDGGDNMDEA